MAESSGAAFRFFKGIPDAKLRPHKGLEHKLRYAFPLENSIFFLPGIQENDQNLSPVVWVNQPDPLGDSQSPDSAKTAARIDEGGYPDLKRRDGDAGGKGSSFSRRDDDGFASGKAGAQIQAGGAGGQGRKAIFSVYGRGITEKSQGNRFIGRRNTCHEEAPVEQ
jgi:hypothetical protein